MKFTSKAFNKEIMAIVQHLFLMLTIYGNLVHGNNCPSYRAVKCTEGRLEKLKSWAQAPTERAFRILCKSNDDMWNCYIANNCKERMTLIKNRYEREKKACSEGYDALVNKTLSREEDENECDLEKYVECVKGPTKIIENWMREPSIINSDYKWKNMCNASDDIWSCVVKTKCEDPDLKEIHIKEKEECDSYNSRKTSNSGTYYYTYETTKTLSTGKIVGIGLSVFSLFCSLVACAQRNASQHEVLEETV